ncbi:hypothetical protein LMG31886_18750 [Xanthomonas hydrangeae]|nr:hypothetical protein LMG31886_18750 [Xanthomonas hydrangeae]CAD7733284.1 hypothetical protein LMG31886_18750 [Xanthomonas hydrangeae]CAD7746426.1 hypothetical protein LMG31885_41480 [Xanthomonas hydrangeae]CAD7746428.1 hypothetical protein LMG31885_41480 [Xanthomonas hydrangeae]
MNGIGIDVCKARLDVAVYRGPCAQFHNTPAGHRKLVSWLAQREVGQIVLEALSVRILAVWASRAGVGHRESLDRYRSSCSWVPTPVSPLYRPNGCQSGHS